MKRSPIGRRAKPLERRRVLKRRRPWRASVRGDQELRTHFHTITSDCARRFELGQRCDGELDPHHVIPKRAIKAYAKTHKLDGRSTASLLWDTGNRLVLCRRHHQLQEGAHDRVPRRLIPASAVTFAETLGLAYLIDRLYPDDVGDRRC